MRYYYKFNNHSYWLINSEIIINSDGYRKVNSFRIKEEAYYAFMYIVYSDLLGSAVAVSRQEKIK